MNHDELKKLLLEDKDFRAEFEKTDLRLEISTMLIAARAIKNVSQAWLAEHIGTKQSGIARAENGNSLPSLTFLEKIAKAYKTELIPPRFKFMEVAPSSIKTNTEPEVHESETINGKRVSYGSSSGLTLDDIMPIKFKTLI